jgi:hypothetical protein
VLLMSPCLSCYQLIVQAIGGGTASAAETNEEANNGAKIMVGGVIFQMGEPSALVSTIPSFSSAKLS